MNAIEESSFKNYVDDAMALEDRRGTQVLAQAAPLTSERSLASSLTVISFRGSNTSRVKQSIYAKDKGSRKKSPPPDAYG